MNYILLDPPPERFYPFTLTRPLAEMRVFGGTIKEIWEKKLGAEVSHLTRPGLSDLYPTKWSKENIIIYSNINPFQFCCFSPLKGPSESVYTSDNFLNTKEKIGWSSAFDLIKEKYANLYNNEDLCEMISIENSHLWNLSNFISHFFEGLLRDQIFLTKNQSNLTKLDCSKSIFFNDDDGPILVEEGVVIMEGAMIRGPVHICEGSIIKMGAKIYGPTVIGPHCKIGGEVSNSIFLGYSNKAHDGFLGHSIIGEWCNIGAGSSNSNLKNNYDTVKLWDYETKKFQDSGEQFLGLFLGDHSKCAINTSFNTGTTVGVNCNIFGSSFPRNYVPSFSWGGSSGYKDYNIKKAIETAKKVMSRRSIKMSSHYENMLTEVFHMTSSFRF